MPNATHSNQVLVSDLVKHPRNGSTELFLVRHGRTLANVNHLLVGATDYPLDDLGERQAHQVARRFQTIPVDSVLTSPLQRAKTTAERIGAVTRRTPEIVPGLTEINFGAVEGLTIQQVVSQFPDLRPHLGDFENLELAWPGGDSRRGFAERIMATFLGIIDRFENQRVAVVCHGGVIGAFCAQVGVGPTDNAIRWAVSNCSITHLSVTPDHTRLELWNDVTHLDEGQAEIVASSPTLLDD
ncbi:MAG TPA: histidine phosphatase family protein [Thermomicrobiales bacterium]|nr:histidine phosphatase family protein [Thermomicrobiales bacterium]